MNQEKTLTIRLLYFGEKYVDFWFEEEKKYHDVFDDDGKPTGEKEETWSMCCKVQVLLNAVGKADLNFEIDNYGFVGKKIKWRYNESYSEWELVEILK